MNEKIEKVDGLDLYIVNIPLIKPFETSFGIETHKEALLIKLTAAGVSGWGECVASPAPYYSYETNQTAYHIIKDFLVPLVENKKNFSASEVIASFARIRGHHMAKAAVENALLDLSAQQKDVPLYELIGGTHKKIMSGISIGIKSEPAELLEFIRQAVARKYHRVKMKIKRGKDIEFIRAVRKDFPALKLMVDANSDYTMADKDVLKSFDEFDLMMIEQPLDHDDMYFHSLLQREMRTPVCLDESIKRLQDAKSAVQLGSCRVINIKQGRVGGILESNKIRQFCLENNIAVWSGGMLETGIGRAFNIHLQTLDGFVLPGDTSETSRYFAEDIVDRPVVLDPAGYIDIPEGKGIGVEVLTEKLDRFKIYHEKLI